MDQITAIETALIARLQSGLGSMVRSVDSYSGELDDELANVVRAFPACWVTFGGFNGSEPQSLSKQKYKTRAQFVVMVGQHARSGGSASRQGRDGSVGTNLLIAAVRRLLINQDLGLAIGNFKPGRVRVLHNTRLGEGQALQVFALEFETTISETALENGAWPVPTEEADAIFANYGGSRSEPDPDFTTLGAEIRADLGMGASVSAVKTLGE